LEIWKLARIEAYQLGDWEKVEPRELEKEGLRYAPNLEDYILQGPAFTIWNNDTAVLCGGIRIRPDKGGEAWLFCSYWIESHMMVARLVKHFMAAIVKDFELPWVQIIANTNYPKTMRWLSWLGFSVDRRVEGFPQYLIYKRTKWA
jgi:hypothetical protein